MTYDVWVVSDASGKWEQYTRQPFRTVTLATAFVRRYLQLPGVVYEIRPHPGD